jgi:hypothetical protein
MDMPVIRDIPLSLKIREVLRREGVRGHLKIRPDVKSLVVELLAYMKKTRLLEPAVAYEIYSIIEMEQ